ncbi:PREDICTED: neogenin-like, partial [Priapulus caudatus]|uniref:Neogenin-like n=1 Tax=Priapulus caudatus TaxID=37621 RepID=A0ABM1F7R9_PRICU
REDDTGTYTCRAENVEDSVDSGANVEVQVPPFFVERPRDTVESESSDIEIVCDIYGRPEPTITWFKNGETIGANDYFKISLKSLRIKGLVKNDEGVYQCFGQNAAGNVQASAQLIVVPQNTSTHPRSSGSGGARSAQMPNSNTK